MHRPTAVSLLGVLDVVEWTEPTEGDARCPAGGEPAS
jgi:hypothetical protein